MRKKNLLIETLDDLHNCGFTEADVRWVGSDDGGYSLGWAEFAEIAQKTVYDAGYGSADIALDLVVVGDTWWLERSENDGSEEWVFKTIPIQQAEHKPFTAVFSGKDNSLEEINSTESVDA